MEDTCRLAPGTLDVRSLEINSLHLALLDDRSLGFFVERVLWRRLVKLLDLPERLLRGLLSGD